MPKVLHARFLLCLPAAALVVGATAAPVIAEPGRPPGGGSDDRAQTAIEKRPPMPAQAKVPDHAAARGPQTVAPPPGRPRGRGAAAPAAPKAPAPKPPAAQAPAAPGAVPPADTPRGNGNGVAGVQGSKLGRVVVCKWVRKPGVAEIPSHVIVVNGNALVGKGFAGTFPFPFSDGQVNSVAIRWAEKGESAREIDDAVCTTPPVVSLASLPAPGPVDPPAVLDLVETAPVAAPEAAPATAPDPLRVAPTGGDALPATGAQEHLRLLLVLGGIATLLGALLMGASRLRRSAPGT